MEESCRDPVKRKIRRDAGMLREEQKTKTHKVKLNIFPAQSTELSKNKIKSKKESLLAKSSTINKHQKRC